MQLAVEGRGRAITFFPIKKVRYLAITSTQKNDVIPAKAGIHF
jgi:hypothetical protein